MALRTLEGINLLDPCLTEQGVLSDSGAQGIDDQHTNVVLLLIIGNRCERNMCVGDNDGGELKVFANGSDRQVEIVLCDSLEEKFQRDGDVVGFGRRQGHQRLVAD